MGGCSQHTLDERQHELIYYTHTHIYTHTISPKCLWIVGGEKNQQANCKLTGSSWSLNLNQGPSTAARRLLNQSRCRLSENGIFYTAFADLAVLWM